MIVMIYILDIHWQRRAPQEGKPNKGFSTVAQAGRSLRAAITTASRKFNRTYGQYLAIDRVNEKADPAGIFR
jgi:hypothetical protein